MNYLDWIVIGLFFAYTLWDGIRSDKNTHSVEDLLLAGRGMPWWAMGISIMATQASAISFIGTTGQAYMNDMKFIQMYLGLPIAMIILCVTLVPFYHKLRAYTAYEALEEKFGLRVRLFTSFLFLLSRGLAMGAVIAAPAYVLSLILSIPLWSTTISIGLIATIYTTFGGITGVIRTDIKQMVIMMLGLGFCLFWILHKLPDGVGFSETLHLAGAVGKLETLDFSFDTSSKYNVWAGTLAGLFLMLSYFGSDQSQVQRYLTAKSLKDARGSLIMPAFLKIPMIFFMLLIGVGLYTFYIFHKAPVMFLPENGDASRTVIENKLSEEFQLRHQMRRESALAYLQDPSRKGDFQDSDRRLNEVRNSYASLGEDRNDTNYVTPYFILNELPNGVIGLIIAAIFAAALSSIDSGLNSLAASTTMDWVKKMEKEERPAKFYLRVSRTSTVLWGLFATFTALAFGETESIVELVNNVGSYFYGSIFGIFVLLFVKRINGKAAFAAILCGILSVFILDALYITEQGDFLLASPYLFQLLGWFACPDGGKWISFLWLNPIGTLTVVFFGWLFSKMMK